MHVNSSGSHPNFGSLGAAPPPPRDSLARLVFELSKLPGIGEKTATRLAYFILKSEGTYASDLAASITAAKDKIHLCSRCHAFTDIEPCANCADSARDSRVICVVERPSDILSIERSGNFRGRYHVLHGVLSPLDGVGPEELKISTLLARLADGVAQEVILAINPSVEGDATAMYLSRLIRPLQVRVSRLAHGIPVGGQLEFTDRQTLARAIENRMEVR